MKLIVGLGNPGKEYNNTRHNIGYMFLDSIAKDKNLVFDKEKFNAKYVEYTYNGEKVILIKPLSFMNLSGDVVRKYVDYFKVDIIDILIIHDDLDMPVGKIKLKQNGSSGGHNGIKDISLKLGTEEFKRLKVGIANNKNMDTKDYVLGKFNDEEKELINEAIEETTKIIDDYLEIPFNDLMSRYNGVYDGLSQ